MDHIYPYYSDYLVALDWVSIFQNLFIIMFIYTGSYLLVFQVRQWHHLSHISGPWSASISEWWTLRSIIGGDNWRELGLLCEKYGTIVRTGPNSIVISDLEAIRRIWGVRSQYQRSNYYEAFRPDPMHHDIHSVVDDATHTQLKAKMAAGYSGKENELLESSIDNHIRDLVSLVERKYISTPSVFRRLDLARRVQFFTMDVITDLAFGREFGFLANDEDIHGYCATVGSMLPAMSVVSVFPKLIRLLRTGFVKKYILPSENDPTGLGKVIGIAKEVITQRFGPNQTDQRDMLGSFIRHGLTEEEGVPEILLQLVAGSDTTATAIRSTFLHLLTSPNSYIKIKTEIHSAVSTHRVSSPIQNDEAQKLPYLQACIKEGLRMWPPVGASMYKNPPPEGDTIRGKFIPAGTKVGVCWWAISRNKEVFGDDADVYRPERWLEAGVEKLEAMEKTKDMVFSPGKWQCLGKPVAMIELNKIFFELLRHFDIQLMDPSKPWKSFNAGIFIQSDMFVRVTRSGTTY